VWQNVEGVRRLKEAWSLKSGEGLEPRSLTEVYAYVRHQSVGKIEYK